FSSCLGGFLLSKVCYRMAAMLLPLAGFSEKAMNIVAPGCGQFVLDAPDFLEDQIAPTLDARFIWGLRHMIRLKVLRACRWTAVHSLELEPAGATEPRSSHLLCGGNYT